MQQPRVFQAPTAEEAYQQVREALGEEAIILSTRTAGGANRLGIGRRAYVEVVADLPGDAEPQRVPLSQDAAVHDLVRAVAEADATHLPLGRVAAATALAERDDDSSLAPPFVNPMAGVARRGGPFDAYARTQALADQLVGVARERTAEPPSMSARSAAAPALGRRGGHPFAALDALRAEPEELDEPFEDEDDDVEAAALLSVAKPVPVAAPDVAPIAAIAPAEITAMHDALAQITGELDDLRALVRTLARTQTVTRFESAPAPIRQAYEALLAVGAPNEWVQSALESATAALGRISTTSARRTAVTEALVAALPEPVKIHMPGRPAGIFVTGPAGAGKTTFAIRLALQLRMRGLRVTIAGTDVDRVGAPQQLEAYGAATSLPVAICYTPGELQSLMGATDSEVVIIDTPGYSGGRRERVAELRAFARVAPEAAVLLALPATMQADEMQRVVEAHAPLQPAALAFTRCDEAAGMGAALATVARAQLGIAYTIHGEAITDAPRPGDHRALVASVLEAAWPAPRVGGGKPRKRE